MLSAVHVSAPAGPRHALSRRTDIPRLGPSPDRFIDHRLDRRDRLPRKEVIQPQLPLRLPCYDFVPITRPTLDGCPPCGLAHRLQVLPAFVT